MNDAFNPGRYLRTKAKRYRLEGLRYRDGSVTLGSPRPFTHGRLIETWGRISNEFSIQTGDLLKCINDLINAKPNNISNELAQRLIREGIILQIEEQYTLNPTWNFLRDLEPNAKEPEPVDPLMGSFPEESQQELEG